MIGCRLHVGGSVHRIGRCCLTPPSSLERLSGEVDDRAIFVSGDDIDDDDDGDVEDEDVERREGVSALERLPIIGGGTGVAIDLPDVRILCLVCERMWIVDVRTVWARDCARSISQELQASHITKSRLW